MNRDGDLRRALFPLYENGRLNLEKVKLINHYMAEFEESKAYDKLLHETEADKAEDARRLKMLKSVKRRMMRTRIMTSILSSCLTLGLVLLVFLYLNTKLLPINYDGQIWVEVTTQNQVVAQLMGGVYDDFQVHLIKVKTPRGEDYHLYFQLQASVLQTYLYKYEGVESEVELMSLYTHSQIKVEPKRIDRIYYYTGKFDEEVTKGKPVDKNSFLLWEK